MIVLFYLSKVILATSAPCERGFSLMNWIKDNRKNSLKVENTSKRIKLYLTNKEFANRDVDFYIQVFDKL